LDWVPCSRRDRDLFHGVVRVCPRPDAAVEIQRAIDRLAADGGGTVHVAAGRYALTDAIRLASGVTLAGISGKTVLAIGPGLRTGSAADVHRGDTTVTVLNAFGFNVGDGVAIQDAAGHGFEVTTATLAKRLGPASFRLSVPAGDEYLMARQGWLIRAYPGIGGWRIAGAAVHGIVVEGNHGQRGSAPLGGCRGGGIYLYGCNDVAVTDYAVRGYHGDAISEGRWGCMGGMNVSEEISENEWAT